MSIIESEARIATARSVGEKIMKAHKFSADATPFNPAAQMYDIHMGAVGGGAGVMHSALSPKAPLFTPAEMESYAFLASASVPYSGARASAKKSQKAATPFMPMAHPAVMQPYIDSMINQYSGAPIMRLPYQRETTMYDGQQWSAVAEGAAGRRKASKMVEINHALWVPVEAFGKKGTAPALLFPRDVTISPFEHMYCVYPSDALDVELELYFYLCSRCSLKTLYGRLSSRKADLVISGIAQDIPPISIAHLIEQITTAKIVALIVSDTETYQIEMWIERPNQASQVVSILECGLWTCPMFHGYAVYCKNERNKQYVEAYLERLRKLPGAEQTIYPTCFAEAHEPSL